MDTRQHDNFAKGNDEEWQGAYVPDREHNLNFANWLIERGYADLSSARQANDTLQRLVKEQSRLDELSGITNWTLHDLRRTFATNLAQMAVAPHVIERLLNHVTGTISGVTAVYNRATYMSEMREAVALWEIHLKQLLNPT
jgi:integrase